MSPTVPPSDTLQARFMDLFAPLRLLFYSFLHLPATILSHPLLLLQPHSFQSAWFGNVWKFLGPQMALSPEQIPYISHLFNRARGVVLELGPGNGDQMRHFANVVQQGMVSKVVGAEPNEALHNQLLLNAKGVGLDPKDGKYIAIKAGAEPASLIPALHKAGLYESNLSGEGVFDTIICVKSMCCVQQDQLAGICRTIQGLLKPGGWIWPVAMGNCHLNGRVDKVAKDIGGWESVDVRNTREFRGWNIFRYVVGVCKKAK